MRSRPQSRAAVHPQIGGDWAAHGKLSLIDEVRERVTARVNVRECDEASPVVVAFAAVARGRGSVPGRGERLGDQRRRLLVPGPGCQGHLETVLAAEDLWS